jgi:L-arabinose isomerase
MKKLYFVIGSQDLYGDETLKQAFSDGKEMANFLDTALDDNVAVEVLPIVRNSKEAEKLLIENIRNGNQTSVSLLKELYERCGYERQAIEMAHLESYNEIVRDHERE